MKRLAGTTWVCTQNTLSRTYNIYVKPIIKYGSENLISATHNQLEKELRTKPFSHNWSGQNCFHCCDAIIYNELPLQTEVKK